ncbi:DUF1540 domain-containing protein [Clostridium tarantellae]|uniref:DUF1540 domain-containing protein n=1 Tax=Clostridium tarantellae TaxID=39493 RepID=A0A6I1MPH8_9CLOT|nr:DUF1540 domain-containing protein [Clostridium tarantellae]MPQ44703.1 DUF1540 domain-containing protein [Clostridium tarantellae]
MQKINCTINTCSHNNSGICYANRVDIGGFGAKTDCNTCCGSFLSQNIYGNLTNNTNDSSHCTALVCKVNTCTYNDNSLCNLPSITVTGHNPIAYTETNCSSFNFKK